MKRIKKVAFVALSAVVLGSAAYVGNRETSIGDEFDLLHSNVEALTTPETNTSWSCIGKDKKCEQECGMCGTRINSEGTLTGSHSCSM